MFLDLKKNETKKNFIYHLVQQNLRLQMNRTDFKVLYFFLSKSIKYSPYYTPGRRRSVYYSEYFWWDCAEGNSAVQFTKERQNVCVCDVTWSDRHTPTQGDTDRQHSEEKHTKHSHESLHISFSCASLLKHSEIKRCSNT